MQTCRTFSRGKQPGYVRHLGIGIHPDSAHHIVGRGPNFHGLPGDIDIGQLLELVIHAGQLLFDMFGGIRNLLFDPGDVEEHAPVRASTSFPYFTSNAAGHVVAGQQFGRAPGILITLGVTPTFFLGIGRLVYIKRRNVLEHEALVVSVAQHPSFAPYAFRDQNAAHAGRPDHSGGMELHKFHVHQRRAGMVCESVAISGVLPAVAGDLVSPANTSRRQHDGFGTKQVKSPALAIVAKCSGDAIAIL